MSKNPQKLESLVEKCLAMDGVLFEDKGRCGLNRLFRIHTHPCKHARYEKNKINCSYNGEKVSYK